MSLLVYLRLCLLEVIGKATCVDFSPKRENPLRLELELSQRCVSRHLLECVRAGAGCSKPDCVPAIID